jgi:hypothetical protein
MWKSSVAFLLALTSLVANAQIYKSEKTVVCNSLKNLIEYVSSQYDEVPFWNGVDDNSKYILMVNQLTKSWTMIQYQDNDACVIGTGNRANLINLGKRV